MREYSNALDYLYNLEKFGIVFGLENITWILDLIGNPEHSFHTVHVGGTNGKGSVACMISAILMDAGYRVGRYTSPHLVSFTERIAINDEPITENDVVDLTAYIREKTEGEDRNRFFTFFDFTTALAFEYFSREKTDISVVEVGLGGRLDSSNVIHPLVSVITNVAFDHMDYLGETIEEIATEKAGIIKDRVPVVTGADGIALRIIEETAREHKSPVYLMGRDFMCRKVKEQRCSYSGPGKELPDLFVNLKGDHQLTNAALALCATEVLSSEKFTMDDASMCRALATLRWPGRLEVVKERPLVVLDAAHNPHGVHSLAGFMDMNFTGRRKIVIFGVMKDKEYEKMLKELRPRADVLILTRPETERALSPDRLKAALPHSVVTRDVRSALDTAKKMAGDNDVIVVTGSFYTVGEARTLVDEIF